jgi:F-type H+-transporting ATPase subunit gamma
MPNLKDIRRRIKSVKSTQKITQAMRMVAAAKVKRAEARMRATRPYANALQETFAEIYGLLAQQGIERASSKYADLLVPRDVKNVGLLVISSDRGLCGAYNTNIIRQGMQAYRRLKAEGKEPHFYLVGNKAIQAFSRIPGVKILGRMANMTASPAVHHASVIAESLIQSYLNGSIDAIEVITTQFRSLISFKVTEQSLIPVDTQALNAATDGASSRSARGELLLEPSLPEVLDQLVPMYLSRLLYAMLLDASASELASRMMAMSNASNNASEMISRLTLSYNKARQASITQEILEVVSGAQALG